MAVFYPAEVEQIRNGENAHWDLKEYRKDNQEAFGRKKSQECG